MGDVVEWLRGGWRRDSGSLLTCCMDEKESPCLGDVDDGRADGLAVPTVFLPAWLNLQDRQAGVAT